MVFEYYKPVNLFYLIALMSHVCICNPGVYCSILFLLLHKILSFSTIMGGTVYFR